MNQNHLTTMFWGPSNPSEFIKGIQHSINYLPTQTGIYTGDNLFTFGRNLSFLEDAPFMTAVKKHATDSVEQAIVWRTAVLLWGVRNGLKLEGDFVEGGCYKGTSVRILCDAVDFGKIDKRYYLYDLFEHDPSMPHHAMPEHSKRLHQSVVDRFADLPNVIVKQGKIPDVLTEVAPEKIAFMHLDMNNAPAEIGALGVLFERMVPGALLVLDDYGWFAYRAQKLAEDPWFAARGFNVMEMPTGQGLVIKQ